MYGGQSGDERQQKQYPGERVGHLEPFREQQRGTDEQRH
jgi:hypothetical protein